MWELFVSAGDTTIADISRLQSKDIVHRGTSFSGMFEFPNSSTLTTAGVVVPYHGRSPMSSSC